MSTRASKRNGGRDRRQHAARLRQEQQARERRRRRLVVAGVGTVALLVVGGVTAGVVADRAGKPELRGVQSFTEERGHVAGPVTYPQSPPAGGPHNPVWLNCGAYASPVPNENAVHALEHGSVWITYRPDLSANDVSKLTALARGQDYVTVSPFPGLPAPVVISAWGKQLALTGATDSRLQAFESRYRLSPDSPEPGAACSGGIGTPS